MTFIHNNQTYELLLLHLAGSKLYGNSTPLSDTDFRGIFLASKETKLGILGSVQQLEGIEVYKSLKKAGLDLEETEDVVIWEWKCKRNETRSAMEAEFGIDLKNLSHLWRLMTKAKEILITGDYKPELQGEELKTLKGIRDGSLYGNGSYDFALKFAEENDKELDELYKTTKLPKKPDMIGINKLVLKLQGV